jgi:hypothetical protein
LFDNLGIPYNAEGGDPAEREKKDLKLRIAKTRSRIAWDESNQREARTQNDAKRSHKGRSEYPGIGWKANISDMRNSGCLGG